jgi:hypothetical protein
MAQHGTAPLRHAEWDLNKSGITYFRLVLRKFIGDIGVKEITL